MKKYLFAWIALGACGDNATTGDSKPKMVLLGQVSGQDAQEWTGYSFGAVGDVNGDGKPDFVSVGLSAANGGRVGLIYGPFSDSISSTQSDVIVTGERGFENLGESSLEAGGCDIDGDGYADLLLASPFGDRNDIGSVSTSGDNTGRLYVFYGGKSLPRNLSATTADETFVGEMPYDVAGKSVACLGDLDGDKHDDFAIGAPRGGANHEGRVYVIYGRARHTYGTAPVGLETADAVLNGVTAHQLAGATIARAGDLDGDGHQDIAIGAPGTPAGDGGKYGGAVYIVLGTGARLPKTTTLGAITIRGATGRRLGQSLTRAGDFDGDKLDDLLIGSSPVMSAASSPGEAYLVRGRKSFAATLDASAEVVLRGELAGDAAGVSVAGLGDLNRDGFADIAVGAVHGTGDEASAGRVYFIKGRASPPATISLGDEFVAMQGAHAKDYFAEVIRSGGDINGDGFDDLLISARGAVHDTTASAGSIYIISGKGLGGQ